MKIAVAGGVQWPACWNAGYWCEEIGDLVGRMTDEDVVYDGHSLFSICCATGIQCNSWEVARLQVEDICY